MCEPLSEIARRRVHAHHGSTRVLRDVRECFLEYEERVDVSRPRCPRTYPYRLNRALPAVICLEPAKGMDLSG